MLAIHLNDTDVVEIPDGLESLEQFRRWTRSDAFPERGRIDFINGRIDADMTADRINTHSVVVGAIAAAVASRVRELDLGQLLTSQTRVASALAGLSAEPDLSVVSWESLRAGRVRYVLAENAADPSDFKEVEGGPDLVVEVVSPSSVNKDRVELPPAYFRSGVREYWLVDARGPEVSFVIFGRGQDGFEAVAADADGFRASVVLGAAFRLTRRAGAVPNTFVFRLEQRD